MSEEAKVTPESNAALDVESAVAMYVELRDTKAALKEKLRQDLKPYDAALQKLEAILLKHMQDTGTEGLKTKAGTAYQFTARSATIKDGAAFKEFVITNQQWDLADWRASKVQVFDYIEKHGTDVPGVNTSAVATVGVRRGTEE